MWILLAGLAIFLGIHSLRMVAPGWRDAAIARGEGAYKGVYSLLSAIGLGLIVWGYGVAAPESEFLFVSPRWATHLAGLVIMAGVVCVALAYVPAGRLRPALRHPMITGVILWSGGHLLANGDVVSLALFGAFLVWAVINRVAVEGREDPLPAPGPVRNDVIAIVIGIVGGLVFVLWLHGPLIGVAPYG